MKQFGIVQRVRGEHVEVLVSRPAACKSCGACQLAENRPHAVVAKNLAHAEAGETVVLEIAGSDVLRAALVAYGVPLVGLIVGLALGPYVFRMMRVSINHSIASAVGGLLFLALGYYLVHVYDRSLGPGAYVSVATEVVDPENLHCPEATGLRLGERPEDDNEKE